jgi:nucleotide-binding universal stress UspA family protein
MQSRMLFLRDSAQLPPDTEQPERPLELVVPYTNPSLAAQALSAALGLARGFQAAVTLMAVHVLPYPSPLEAQEGIRQRLEAELAAVARTCPVAVRVKLVFARDRDEAYLGLLRRASLVVVGARDRWWKTREERFARKLAAHGHSVAVIKVE